MALINNPNVYTGGNVVFDNSRGLDLAAQLQAKKAAKDEALNQYFNDLPNKINTAGVRKQDLDDPKYGGINREIEAWRTNWLQNKDAIKKGGIPQQEHLGKFQEILRKIEQSKQRAKTEMEIGKAKFEGKYDPDEDDIGVLSQIGKSIYDPTSYKQDGVSEYGWSDLSPAVPEFDADKQTKFWAGITKGLTPGKIYDYENKRLDKVTGQAIVPFKKIYQPDQIKRIADEAADAVTADKSARKFYKKVLDDPQSTRWQELNKAYQSVYGTDKIVSTPEQAAAADAIIRASMPQEQSEEQELQRQPSVRVYTGGGRGGGSDTEKEVNDVYDIIDRAATEKKKEGKPYLQMNLLPVDAQTLVIDFAKKATNKDYSQEDLKIIKGDDGRIGIYDADSNLFLGYLRRVGTNLKVQPGVGEKREVVAQGDVEQPKTKMVTVVLGNGRKGQIPSDKVAQFLKDNPGSKRL